eukprot:12129485-Karenia_brevis.AAC.1
MLPYTVRMPNKRSLRQNSLLRLTGVLILLGTVAMILGNDSLMAMNLDHQKTRPWQRKDGGKMMNGMAGS